MRDIKRVSFADLTRLLKRHGFTMTRVKGSHHLFTHTASETTIMLPDDSSNRTAMPVQVAGVRRILDERGLLSCGEFDVEVRGVGANGRANERGRTRAKGAVAS